MTETKHRNGTCMMCLDDDVQVRYIDLYIVGSEGLVVCHDCEMKIVDFIGQKRYDALLQHGVEMKRKTKERHSKMDQLEDDHLGVIYTRGKEE